MNFVIGNVFIKHYLIHQFTCLLYTGMPCFIKRVNDYFFYDHCNKTLITKSLMSSYNCIAYTCGNLLKDLIVVDSVIYTFLT